MCVAFGKDGGALTGAANGLIYKYVIDPNGRGADCDRWRDAALIATVPAHDGPVFAIFGTKAAILRV